MSNTIFRKKRIVCVLLCVLMLMVFALPISAAERMYPEMEDFNAAEPALKFKEHKNKTKEKEVIVGGCLFGVRLYTDGVPVVGVDSFESDTGKCSPAHDAGIKLKDIIIKINGVSVNSASHITALITGSGGKTMSFTVLRGGKEKELSITPVKAKDGMYRAGIWLRDNAAGIGTVTYIIPETKEFAGLGHGICDGETMSLMPLLRGSVSEVELNSVVKGQVGIPGELKGSFRGGKTGSLISNKNTGVYGVMITLPSGVGEKLPVAAEHDVKEGDAIVRCSVSGSIRDYTVKISKVNCHSENGKNFVVEVTDPALLEITGGIVQGMSGSPLIQNGKLIGAVTHVMVNNPTTGYGIFIGNMLENA